MLSTRARILLRSSDLFAFCICCVLPPITMASLLKESKKAKGKRKADDMDVDRDDHAPATKKPRNKQRVLMLSSRGINYRMRHLMNDLEVLLPHVKKGECVWQTLFPSVR